MTSDEEILDNDGGEELEVLISSFFLNQPDNKEDYDNLKEFIVKKMKLAREDVLAQIKKSRSEGKYILYCPDAPNHEFMRGKLKEKEKEIQTLKDALQRIYQLAKPSTKTYPFLFGEAIGIAKKALQDGEK